MDHRADGDPSHNVPEDLPHRSANLLPGVGPPVGPGQLRQSRLHGTGSLHVALHIPFHPHLLDDRSGDDGDDETDYNVSDGNSSPEDTHQDDERAQIHQRRGDQEGKGHPQGEPGAGEADEEGDGGAGAEGGDRPQERGERVGAKTVKVPQNPLGPLRRKVALDVGDQVDQDREEEKDLDHIVEEELQAPPDSPGGIQPQGGEALPDQEVQPPHPQELVLKEEPQVFQEGHGRLSSTGASPPFGALPATCSIRPFTLSRPSSLME